MTETKSQAFHRLAGQRVEAIADKIRIFSNLANPGYEWTPAEVFDYGGRIQASLDEALARFKDTKRWRTAAPIEEPAAAPAPAEAAAADELVEEPTDQPTSQMAIAARSPKPSSRQMKIGEIIAEANRDPEVLAEMIQLQRVVLERQQEELAQFRSKK